MTRYIIVPEYGVVFGVGFDKITVVCKASQNSEATVAKVIKTSGMLDKRSRPCPYRQLATMTRSSPVRIQSLAIAASPLQAAKSRQVDVPARVQPTFCE